MTRIAIIVGSTRPRRRAKLVARWVQEVAVNHTAGGGGQASFEVIDLADYALPLLDEPLPAAIDGYEHAHTKRWGRGRSPRSTGSCLSPPSTTTRCPPR